MFCKKQNLFFFLYAVNIVFMYIYVCVYVYVCIYVYMGICLNVCVYLLF